MNNKKITILGTCIFILLTIWAYFSLYNPKVDNVNEKPAEVNSGVNTSDWVEYSNTALGYKIKFPSSFKAYSEMTGEEVVLRNDAKAIFMNDKKKVVGFMISQSSTASKTIDEALDYQAAIEGAEIFLINDNKFVYSPGAQAYFVGTKSNFIVFHFLANSDENKNYISKLILESFEIIQ